MFTRHIALLIVLITGWPALGQACTPFQQPAYDATLYYNSAFGLHGAALKAELNRFIRNHQAYSYTPCMWSMLEEADEDPANPNNIMTLYTQRSVPKSQKDQGGNTPDHWNREHVWAKSHGFPNRSQHAHTDGHALHAADKSVNADRLDHDFAEGGTPNWECSQCLEGNGTWEPPDAVKGDIARMMFYMDTRYEGTDFSGTPDLTLVDHITSVGDAQMGKLCTLLQWHLDDPVSSKERQRNAVVYRWQGNRNPFVDHPEFAVPIWGDTCGIAVAPAPAVPELPIDKEVPLPLWAFALLGALLFRTARTQARRG